MNEAQLGAMMLNSHDRLGRSVLIRIPNCGNDRIEGREVNVRGKTCMFMCMYLLTLILSVVLSWRQN